MNYADGFFGGVITAMITPMRKNSSRNDANSTPSIDYDVVATLAVHLVNNGSDALVLSGTTGEAPTTHLEEKGQLIEVVRTALDDAFPDKHIPLIAGVGSNDTVHVLRNIGVATQAGADGLLIVSPYYSRPSVDGLVAHFEAVCRATLLPVILYDVPARSGVEIVADMYERIAELPNFVAIKDATGDVANALRKVSVVNQKRRNCDLPDITLYAGDDTLFLPFLAHGAKGVISVASHLVGTQFSQVLQLWNDGNTTEALSLFNEILPIIDALNGTGQQAACTKAALKLRGIIPDDIMRLPNVALNGNALEEFRLRLP